MLNLLLANWRLVVALPLVVGLMAAAASLLLPRSYRATAAFVPETGAASQLSPGIASLAGQFGITAASAANQSPQFYASVLMSRAVMLTVLQTRFVTPGASAADSGSLMGILGEGGRTPRDSIYRAVRTLRKRVSYSIDNLTNIVQFSAEASDPALAAAITNRFMETLDDFNTRVRRSREGEKRQFAMERLDLSTQELEDAEVSLRVFYDANHSWQHSPQLTFEEGRLRRQVQIQQEVYLTLRREYEAARIAEVNDTPTITIIDHAVPPVEPFSPNALFVFVAALLFSGTLSVIWVLMEHYLRRTPETEEEAALHRRLDSLVGPLRRLPGSRFRPATEPESPPASP